MERRLTFWYAHKIMGTSENLVTNTSSSHMRGAGERLKDREERSEFRGTCGGESITYMNTNIPSLKSDVTSRIENEVYSIPMELPGGKDSEYQINHYTISKPYEA